MRQHCGETKRYASVRKQQPYEQKKRRPVDDLVLIPFNFFFFLIAFSAPFHLIKLAEFRSSIVLFSPDVLEHLDPSRTRRTSDLKPVAFKCDHFLEYPETR